MTLQTSPAIASHGPAPAESSPRLLALDDETTFEAFYREHVGFVWRNLLRVGVSSAEVEDVCQDVFVTVHRSWSRFEARGTTRSWLYGILRRVASRHRRGVDRRRRRHAAFRSRPRSDTTQAEVVSGALVHELQQFLSALDLSKREVFILAELEQLTAPEISAQVGAGPNTVYSRLRAARAAFERRFGPLPRQRDALRRAHLHDAPSPTQRNRGWLALAALPWPDANPSAAPPLAPLQRASKWLIASTVFVAAAAVVSTVVGASLGGRAPTADDRRGEMDHPVIAAGRQPEPAPRDQPARRGALPRGKATSTPAVAVAADATGHAPVAARLRPPDHRTSSRPPRLPERPGVGRTEAADADLESADHATPPRSPPPLGKSVGTARTRTTRPRPKSDATATATGQSATIRVDSVDPAHAARPAAPRGPVKSGAPPRTAGEPDDAPTPADRLGDKELALLNAAQRDLDAGHPRRALGRLRTHARRFPDSPLAAEREASVARAFCAAGRPSAARPALQRLRRLERATLADKIWADCR